MISEKPVTSTPLPPTVCRRSFRSPGSLVSAPLHPIYCQRIGRAVEAVRSGAHVTLHADGSGDSAYLVWMDRYRHVIASGSERGMRVLLIAAQAEFDRQMSLERSAVV